MASFLYSITQSSSNSNLFDPAGISMTLILFLQRTLALPALVVCMQSTFFEIDSTLTESVVSLKWQILNIFVLFASSNALRHPGL